MNGCKYCKKPCTECEFDSCIKDMGDMGEAKYNKLQRNRYIVEAFYQGQKQKTIAAIYELSLRHIQRILRHTHS